MVSNNQEFSSCLTFSSHVDHHLGSIFGSETKGDIEMVGKVFMVCAVSEFKLLLQHLNLPLPFLPLSLFHLHMLAHTPYFSPYKGFFESYAKENAHV